MEDKLIEKAKAFINEHLKDEFSLSQLAQHVSYSSFHLAREFKEITGLAIMEYTRNQRIASASKDIEAGRKIADIAMDYCFDTHAGFTKAFTAVFGCTPKEYQDHFLKTKTVERDINIMDTTNIKIRHICRDDVQDLWENVYSAMTPRQITEDKIIPMIEAAKNGTGLELVAELEGKVVMSLPMTKATWLPLGFVWDNNFVLTGGDSDKIMQRLMDELIKQAKRIGIGTLISAQSVNSKSSKAMQSFGFQKVNESGDWEYLMMSI
jgi:AraC-like DNA-binding protein